MPMYMIGYDLSHKNEVDYDVLINSIKSNFATRWHHLDSTWIVKSTMSAAEICNLLLPDIHDKDKLLVVELTVGSASWYGFNDAGSKWLIDHL